MEAGIIKHEPSKFDLLAKSPKWSMLDKVEAKSKLTDMMQHATVLNGGTKEPDVSIFKVHIDGIYEDLLTVYSWLTVAELQTVFKEGLRGAYGEFFGINYKTVSGWIIAYRDSPERKAYLAPPKPEPVKVMLTKEQKERDDREYLQFMYSTYNPESPLHTIDPNLYPIIWANKLDCLDPEERDVIKEIAKGKYEEYKDDALMNINIEIKNEEEITKQIARRLAVKALFDKWRAEGKTQLF